MAALTNESERGSAPTTSSIFPRSMGSATMTRCNLFFLGQRPQESDKKWLTSYHLIGIARLWYDTLEEQIGHRERSINSFSTTSDHQHSPIHSAN